MKWEYCNINCENVLDKLGDEGWELVSVVLVKDNLNFYLKRPKMNFTDRVTIEQKQKVYEQTNTVIGDKR